MLKANSMKQILESIKHKKKHGVKQNLLKKAIHGLLTAIKTHMPGSSCIRGSEIYVPEGIPKRTYIANFYNTDDLVGYCYEALAQEFEQAGFNPIKAPNYKIFFETLLLRLRQYDDYLKVMLDQSSQQRWEEIMEGIRPVITYRWEGRFSAEAVESMFGSFTCEFTEVLREWAELDFPNDHIGAYVARLINVRAMIERDGTEWSELLS